MMGVGNVGKRESRRVRVSCIDSCEDVILDFFLCVTMTSSTCCNKMSWIALNVGLAPVGCDIHSSGSFTKKLVEVEFFFFFFKWEQANKLD